MNKAMYFDIQYSNGEIGRLYECIFYHMMETITPDWKVMIETDDVIKFWVSLYNNTHKYPLDFAKIMENVDRIRRMNNRPSKEEMVHAYNIMGFTKQKSMRQLKIGEVRVVRALEMDEVVKYELEDNEDMIKFTKYLYAKLKDWIMTFSSWVRFKDYRPLPKEADGWDTDKKMKWLRENSPIVNEFSGEE